MVQALTTLQTVTRTPLVESAPIQELARVLREGGETLKSLSPIEILNQLSGNALMRAYQISGEGDIEGVATNIQNQANDYLENAEAAQVVEFAQALKQIKTSNLPDSPSTFSLLTQLSHTIKDEIDPISADITNIFNPTNGEFTSNPLAAISLGIPAGQGPEAITASTVEFGLRPVHTVIGKALTDLEYVKDRANGNDWLTKTVEAKQLQLMQAQQLVENFEQGIVNNLPIHIQGLKDAQNLIEENLNKTFEPQDLSKSIGPGFDIFDKLGLQVIEDKGNGQGQIPATDYYVNALERNTQSTGLANTDDALKDVVFKHISYEEYLEKLQELKSSLQTGYSTADARLKEIIEAKLKLIENLQLQIQDKASYEKVLQEAAKDAVKIREKFDGIRDNIAAFEDAPNWDELNQVIDREMKKGKHGSLNKIREQGPSHPGYEVVNKYYTLQEKYRHQFPLYALFNRHHAEGVKDSEIEENYQNVLREMASPSVVALLGREWIDATKQLLDSSKEILTDATERGRYYKKTLELKQNISEAYQRIATLEQASQGELLRTKAREKFFREEESTRWERMLNQFPWDKFATSKSGQWLMLGVRSLSQLFTTPTGLVTLGVASFALTGPGAITFFLIAGAGLSGFAEQKLDMSVTNALDRQIQGIYARAKMFLDITYVTALEADKRGYLKLSERTDRMESILVQFMTDFKEQFSEDYVQEILFEIVRTKSHLRFDQGFFGSQTKAEFDQDVLQTQERKTYHSLRMQLVLGEIFPPKSFFENLPNRAELEALIPDGEVQYIEEEKWQHILLQDPKFANKFTTEKQIKRRLSQPTDIFNTKEDLSQFPLGFVGFAQYMRAALGDAGLEANAPESHRLKRDVMNLFQVIELGHRLSNAWNYQLGVIAENQANSLIDKNIEGAGVKDANDQYGFASKILRKRAAGLNQVIRSIHKRAKKK